MTSRTPRLREFTAKELDEFAGRLETWAAELRSTASMMRNKRVRSVAIDGGKQPAVVNETLGSFASKARGALVRTGTLEKQTA